MKKVLFTFILAIFACLMLAFAISAKPVYLEEIPDELKTGEGDTATHFVVFEDESYFSINNTTINNLDTEKMAADMAEAGIDASKIGTEYLTRFNFPEGITSINFEAVKGNTYFSNVAGYVQLPSTLTSVNNLRGHCNQVRCVDFGENTQLSSIGAYFCEGASKLMVVKNFPSELITVGSYAFNGCYNAFKGELYINAETIGEKAFNNAIANVTKLTLGPKVTSIGNQSLTVRLAELPAAAKPADNKIQINTIEFQCDVSAVSFNSNAFYFGGAWARSPYEHLETVLLTHIDNEKNVKDGSLISDFTSGNVDVDFGNSTYTLSTNHDFEGGLISYDSFLANGAIICNRCGGKSVADLEPIFTCDGYSVPTTGEISLTVSYRINHEALENYEKSTGTTLEYGLVVAIKSNLGESGAPLNEAGEIVNTSVLQAILNRNYSIFKIKVANIGEGYKDATIVLCGYVIERNSENAINKIVYLEEAQQTASTLEGVTYTGVASKAE